MNKSGDIFIINEEIKKVIKELREKYKADSIIFGIREDDIINNEEEEEEDDDDDNNDDSLDPSYIIKMLYILYKNKKLIPPLSDETKDLKIILPLKKKLLIILIIKKVK